MAQVQCMVLFGFLQLMKHVAATWAVTTQSICYFLEQIANPFECMPWKSSLPWPWGGVDLWLDQKAFAGSSYWGQGSGFHLIWQESGSDQELAWTQLETVWPVWLEMAARDCETIMSPMWVQWVSWLDCAQSHADCLRNAEGKQAISESLFSTPSRKHQPKIVICYPPFL